MKIGIIGAGPGGLTAGMILSSKGYDVEIFEMKNHVGGRNARLSFGDFHFDTGPTFLMMKFILDEIFDVSGEDINEYLKFFKLDPIYSLIFKDKEINMTSDHKKMGEELDDAFPGSKIPFHHFLTQEKERFEHLFPCLQKPYSSYSDFLDMNLVKAIPYLSLGKSMFQELGKYFDNDDLRLAFTFQSKYLGMSAWECPALFNIIPYVEHEFGIYHVQGGLNQISEAMARVITKNNGKINLNTKVQTISTKNDIANGVLLENGDKLDFDKVIINADFANFALENIPHLTRKWNYDKIDKSSFSCSVVIFYLSVDKIYDIPHHNIYFADDYKQNIADIFNHGKLSYDTSFYVQNACITDNTLAPSGKSTIYVLIPVANLKSDVDFNIEVLDKWKENVYDLLETKGKLTDLRSHIINEHIIPPKTWQEDYNVHLGAVFNLGHQMNQLLHKRPHNKFEDIENCYLVGGGTHPGSGLPTIYESGRITANMIINNKII